MASPTKSVVSEAYSEDFGDESYDAENFDQMLSNLEENKMERSGPSPVRTKSVEGAEANFYKSMAAAEENMDSSMVSETYTEDFNVSPDRRSLGMSSKTGDESVDFGSMDDDEFANLLSGFGGENMNSKESLAEIPNDQSPEPKHIHETVDQSGDALDLEANYNDDEFEFQSNIGRQQKSLRKR